MKTLETRSPLAALPPMPDASTARFDVGVSGMLAEGPKLVGKLVGPRQFHKRIGSVPYRKQELGPATTKTNRFGKKTGRALPLVGGKVARGRSGKHSGPIARWCRRLVSDCGSGENFSALVAAIIVVLAGLICLSVLGKGGRGAPLSNSRSPNISVERAEGYDIGIANQEVPRLGKQERTDSAKRDHLASGMP